MISFLRRVFVLWMAAVAGLFFLAGPVFAQGPVVPDTDRRLWYDEPAQQWTEALPVGSGRLGAMVFGRPGQERIQLNEETMWAGRLLDRNREGAHRYIDRARKLLFDGKYVQAERLVGERVLEERIAPRSYQTLGDLRLTMGDTSAAVSDYRRSLSLDSAPARARDTAAGRRRTRGRCSPATPAV